MFIIKWWHVQWRRWKGGGREVEVDSGGVGDFEVETLRKQWTHSRSAPGAKTELWVSKP